MQSEILLFQEKKNGAIQEAPDNGGQPAFLEALRQEVVHGFLDAHARANKNAGKALEIASFCYALIELLEEKGLLSFEEVDERQATVRKRLVQKFSEQGLGVVALQEFDQDKYAYDETVEIDCAGRLHLCRAACCRLDLALSRQDIEEGIVKWDLGRPYMIATGPDNYCAHLDRASCRCAVWARRPIPCRGYDCREDDRIWLDFEEGVINPDLETLLSRRAEMARD